MKAGTIMDTAIHQNFMQ